MMLTADRRLVGLKYFSFTPSSLLATCQSFGSAGQRSRAFSIHGVTCAVMLVVGLLLIHAI